ncbi:MAG: ATP-binding protein [Bdellovibrionota bacterium]
MNETESYRRWIGRVGFLHYAAMLANFTPVYFFVLGASERGRIIHWIYFAALGAAEFLIWRPLTNRWLAGPHADLLACREMGEAHPDFEARARQMALGYVRALLLSMFAAGAINYFFGLPAATALLLWAKDPWNRVLVISSTYMTCASIFVVSRLFWMGIVLNSVLNPVVPEEKFLYRFRISYRIRMFIAATLIGIISSTLYVLYAWFFIGFEFETLIFYAYIPIPLSIVFTLTVGSVIWHRTRPIQRFLVETEEKGRVEDLSIVREAFRSAVLFPYRANNYVWIAMWTVVGGFILYLQVIVTKMPATDALVMLSGIAITPIGVCLYQMNWFRRIFRPFLRHISTNYPEFRLDEIGVTLSTKRKLLFTFVGLVLFALTFAYVTSYQQHIAVLKTQYAREAERWVLVAAKQLGAAPSGLSREELRDNLSGLEAGRAGHLALRLPSGELLYNDERAALSPGEIKDFLDSPLQVADLIRTRRTVSRERLSDESVLFAVLPWDQELFTAAGFLPNIFFFVALLLVSLGVVVYSANELAAPIVELGASAKAIGQGELSHPVLYAEPDEIGNLAFEFERMRRALRGKIEDLERANEEVRKTQRQLLEQERLATIGEMASGIAHEIRNPLSSVKMNLQILKRKSGGDPQDARHFRIAIEEVERLDRIVGDLLLYAKPLALRKEPSAVSSLIERAREAAAAQAGAKGVRFEVRVEPSSMRVFADPGRLQQVLLNLLLNAAQASPPGGTVRILAREENGSVSLLVQDEGPGIAPENLGKIYDPFFTTKADGTGLGLANARKIVLAHGGELRVESSSGKGAAFEIRLPLKEGASA